MIIGRSSFISAVFLTWILFAAPARLVGAEAVAQGELLSKEGSVEFSAARKTNWTGAIVGTKLVVQDRLRTLALSRAMMQLAELGRVRVNELTTLEVLPPQKGAGKATLDLRAGALYFFTRDKPREFQIQTPHALAASRGTEFLVTIEPAGRVVFTVFDGEVELSNPQGTLVLGNGQQGAALPGQAPFPLPAIQAVNIVQWWLYYPGVLDVDEVPLTAAEQAALAVSLNNYRQGDLLAALNSYPPGRLPQSDPEKVLYAGLLLAVGQVDKAEAQLVTVATQPALVNALREAIASVTLTNFTGTSQPKLASEWLARSYAQQAHFDLRGALESARAASRQSTNFGFAWERVAELEFSFGRTDAALEALEHALQLSPRNAQAWALKGFLEAARNRLNEATNHFQTAIAIDPALGNGWLGRGLVRIREGDAQNGRTDLQTAAAMEPNRSLLRSYLGKAFDNVGQITNAQKELRRGRELDNADPTPWLYSALLLRQQLRFNEAVDDLEKSVELNDNRRVYRSRLLLDQDRAVRNANLAALYENAGMEQVAVREAARGVASDYGNYSAHLFLADSFNALRDPTRFNKRYETAFANELFLANLLAPVGAGTLSQSISQQEYSRLFDTKQFGFFSETTYRSDGQFRQLASQFGTVGHTSYSLDAEYQHNEGVRPNNELTSAVGQLSLSHQLTPKDSVVGLATFQDYHSGDNFQYYNPRTDARKDYNLDEQETPNLVAGFHHEWEPGVHTLLLATRVKAKQQFSDKDASLLLLLPDRIPPNTDVLGTFPFNVEYHNRAEIYGAELNQIIQRERHTLVFGARYQNGDIEARDRLLATDPPSRPRFSPPHHALDEGFERFVGYAYYTLEVRTNLFLTGGLAYDAITFPRNYFYAPISEGHETRSDLGPKAALVWSPAPEVTVRGAYATSLGGVASDQSYRLEPVQLAGFDQSFRNIIPGSEAAAASTFDIYGAALDLKFKTRTYVGIQGALLQSRADYPVGAFVSPVNSTVSPAITTHQRSDYLEQSLTATINQLAGDEWSFGVAYQFTRADLENRFPGISPSLILLRNLEVRADLHQVAPYLLFNHASGFFARAESRWYSQENFRYSPALRGDDFWQHNIFVGYRLRRQRGEISFAVLNLGDTDYRLNPLTPYAELPRERTYAVRFRINL